MKHIAVIHLGINGAGPVYTLEMVRALSMQGCPVLAIISKWVDNLNDWCYEEEKGSIKLLLVNSYTSKKDYIQKTLHINCFFRIYQCIREFKADIVYSPMADLWQPFIFGFCVPKKILRVKTIHDMSVHLGESTYIRRLFHRFVFKQADKVITLSRVFVENIREQGIKAENIIVIPHANFSYYNAPAVLPSFMYHNRILFFGRILEYKGLGILLDAMKLVLRENSNLKLVIAGNGELEKYREKLMELSDAVELHNENIQNEAVASYFETVDFVVLPYLEASQSGVIPLAYSFGKPVIASRLGGIPEQVSESTGILVEPNNIQELADSIISLSTNLEKMEYLGRNAKHFADTELSWSKSAEILLNNL